VTTPPSSPLRPWWQGPAAPAGSLGTGAAVTVFLAFAFGYFLSALVRAVTATLAPQFSAELGLSAADLGLLAGAYFFGFALTQLPLGRALDRHGPKRVLLVLLTVGVLGCAAFALAGGFSALIVSRMLIGVGVSACLMAPLTAYRRYFSPGAQMRANSWMLMTGSLGMLASTLPVQWLLPLLGWRGLFWMLAAAVIVAMWLVMVLVPGEASGAAPYAHRQSAGSAPQAGASPSAGASAHPSGYAQVFAHPVFVSFAPMAVFNYGGMVAIQALWAGPWLTQVCGWTPHQAAQGLFVINLSMLLTFLAWGAVVPRLQARGWTTQALLTWGMPVSLVVLGASIAAGPAATAGAWALFCVTSTFVSLTQPAVGQAFDTALAGRALSALNLLIFVGVFVVQWGVGLAIDAMQGAGWTRLAAFQGAFAAFGGCCVLSYLWFLACERRRSQPRTTAVAGT
jgi:MFS family permease